MTSMTLERERREFEPQPEKCRYCDSPLDECRRLVRCRNCGKLSFGRVEIPADATVKQSVREWDGLIVGPNTGEGWCHPDDEGRWLSCPDEWIKPLTWLEYESAVEAERTFWARQGHPEFDR